MKDIYFVENNFVSYKFTSKELMQAVFPLNLVVLPNEKVALHLFEPRYKQLFQDYRSGKEFVIVHQNKGQLAKLGTTVCIEKIIQVNADGTADIVIQGKNVCEILDFKEVLADKLYGGVQVKPMVSDASLLPETREVAKTYFEEINKAVDWTQINTSFELIRELDRDDEFKIKAISANNAASLNCLIRNEIKLLSQVNSQELQLDKRYYLN